MPEDDSKIMLAICGMGNSNKFKTDDVKMLEDKLKLVIQSNGSMLIISSDGQGKEVTKEDLMIIMAEISELSDQKEKEKAEIFEKLLEIMNTKKTEDIAILNENRNYGSLNDAFIDITQCPVDYSYTRPSKHYKANIHPAERDKTPDKITKQIKSMNKDLMKHVKGLRNKNFVR